MSNGGRRVDISLPVPALSHRKSQLGFDRSPSASQRDRVTGSQESTHQPPSIDGADGSFVYCSPIFLNTQHSSTSSTVVSRWRLAVNLITELYPKYFQNERPIN